MEGGRLAAPYMYIIYDIYIHTYHPRNRSALCIPSAAKSTLFTVEIPRFMQEFAHPTQAVLSGISEPHGVPIYGDG